ncbi:hypothetical protein G7054_g4255 [Neopestalotiopsis clavispora]|nr:hypothetical protein G7054_g4255 [Neopestalotiopsis clavispora]
MAEALAAVGVASSIIALVDFSLTLYGHMKEIVADVHDVPKSFRPINTQLPVLMRTLEDIGKAFKDGKLDEETAKVLAPTVERFMTSIQELEKLLAGVLLDPKDRRSKKLWKTLKGVAKESEVKSIVEDVHGYVGTLTFYLAASASSLQPLTDERLIKIRRWLLAPDSSINYQKALLERQANTGQWFLESSLYQNWRESGSSIWLHGIPGCGKTILSTTVVENIQQHTAEDPGKAVAYFYFDFKDQQKQEPDSLVRSLLYQLSQQFVSTPMELDRLYESCRNGENQPHSNALLAALQPVIQAFPHTFIIIDALDECTQRQNLMKVLREIFRWQIEGLHLLVTSRREGDIENTLGQILEKRSILSIQTEAVTHDIQLYIHERLSHDGRLQKWRTDSALHHEIETSLLRNACGMFRWAVCQLDFLGDCRNRRQLLQALKDLPPTLDATYDRILATIRDSDQPYAFRILRWLTFATRPLNLHEVAEIAALEPDRDPTFDREEVLQDPNDVLSICSSLVVVTEERLDEHDDAGKQKFQHMSIVQLAHYSVKEYLVSQRIRTGPAAPYSLEIMLCNTQIAKCCLQYLLQFEDIQDLHEGPLQEFTLKSYSANYWAAHVQDGRQYDEDTTELCFKLLGTSKKAFAQWFMLYNCEDIYVDPQPDIETTSPATRLYFASLFGLTDVVGRMIDNGAHPHAQHRLLKVPPLEAAASNGHISTARRLIERGADVNMVGQHRLTALSAALSRNQIDMARFLMDHGADIEMQCHCYGPPIHAAIAGGINAVQLLLERHCDIFAISNCHYFSMFSTCHGNALQACARYGSPEIAKLLLEYGAQVNGMQGGKMTALQYASEFGNLNMVEFLLAHDADIHEQDTKGNTAIHIALSEGYINIAKVLIEHGTAPNANSPCFNFDHALVNAMDDSKIDIAAFILEYGADPNAISLDNYQPLERAVRSCHSDVRLLFAHGADPNMKSLYGWEDSPFLRAISNDDIDLVKCFIDNGADPDGKGVLKGAPLVLASQRSMDTVRLLLERGADTWCHKELGSALAKVCAEGQVESVEFMISKGAPVNQRDFEMTHPLQSASRYGHLDVARNLLENGADFTANIAGMHEAVSVGNMDMTALLLQHLAAHSGGGAYFGEALKRAVWAKNLTPSMVRLEKDRHYTSSDCLADVGCAEWIWTKPVDMVQFLVKMGATVNMRDDQGSTVLLQAVQRVSAPWLNDFDVVEWLIEQGADVNARDNELGTVLHVALSRGNTDLARLLLEKGANMNIQAFSSEHGPRYGIADWCFERSTELDDWDGQFGTLLEAASLEGELENMKLLIEKGALVEDSHGRFGSALIAASCSSRENPEVTNILLQNGANINTYHTLYGTALSAAARSGHVQIVTLLLERGASLNGVLEAQSGALGAALKGSFEKARQASNKDSNSVKTNTARVIEILVQRGATLGPDSSVVDFVLQATMSNDFDVMKMFLEDSDYSRVFDDEIFNLVLWIASCRGQEDMIHLLFCPERTLDSRGHKIDEIEQYGQALRIALSQHYFDIASFLIEKGANAHFSHLERKRYLDLASAHGYYEVLRFMVEKDTKDAKLKSIDESYSDALVAASSSGHYAIVVFLIENGADVDALSQRGQTALLAASSQGHDELVELLISKGADLNAPNEAFGTALMAASATSYHNIVRLLISNGADVNATSQKLGSALYAAVCRDDYELTKLLLRRHADVNIQGGDYGNALQAALAECNYYIAKRLMRNADINAQGGRFGNALQATLSVSSACRTDFSNRPRITDAEVRRDMAVFLIENGADVIAQGGEYGNAILAALSNSHYHIAEVLIGKGANINARAGLIEKAHFVKFFDDEMDSDVDFDVIKVLIQKAGHISIGNNVAIAALLGGFPDTTRKFLLHQETSFIASATEYRDVLFLAVTHGNFALVITLLDRAKDGTLSDDVVTHLFLLAITWRRDALAKALIDRGANVNAQDEDGHSALQLAILTKNAFMVKTLLGNNADINACSKRQGTALQTAFLTDNLRLFMYFLEQGADRDIRGGQYSNLLQLIINIMEDPKTDEDAEMMWNSADFPIFKGADINAQGGEYGNALQAALSLGKPGLARLFIRKGADVHILGGKHGNMVQAALSGGCRDLAEVLIRQGVDVNANDGFDEAISTALSKGYDNVVNLLLEDCKDLDLTDEELYSSLQEAVLEGDVDSAKAWTNLIVKYSKPDGWQRKLNDAVAAALAHGHHDIFKFLVGKGAKIDLEAFRRCADV